MVRVVQHRRRPTLSVLPGLPEICVFGYPGPPGAPPSLALARGAPATVRVPAQEVPGVLFALPKLFAFVGVPGTGLAHDPPLDPEIDQAAFPADPEAEQDVELRVLERRGELVLDDLDPGAAANRLGAVLEGLDPAHVEPNG